MIKNTFSRPLRAVVAEDEFFLAMDMAEDLKAMGVEVIGVKATLPEVRQVISSTEGIDVAVLDINLQGEMVYPAADELIARGIPVVFATGYDSGAIPQRYRHIEQCVKPICATRLAEAVRKVVRH